MVARHTDLTEAFTQTSCFTESAALFVSKHPRVFVFSGIAKNQSFLESLASAGLEVTGCRQFADHYAYTAADLKALQDAALVAGAELLVTTEKDHAKLQGHLGLDLAVFGVQIDFFGKEQAFNEYFLQALGLASR